MPEGDTIARAARALHRALAGSVVTAFATGLAPLARVDDDTPIAGRTVEACTAHGKHLLMQFSGALTLRTHWRMHGSWHLYRPGERWRRPVRAARIRLDTATWVAVAFDMPVAEFVRAADLARHRPLATLGPDLADDALDVAAAAARLGDAGPRPIGDALLDQRLLAGLGNVLRAETLFLAGLHPERAVASLAPGELDAVVRIGARLVRRNARPDAGHTRNTTGRRAPGESLWVYQRTGAPCRRCGTPIRSAMPGIDGRRVYWCPTCQPATH
ncbi:MAG: DNA-formamidopyrimidine glycosylase family protein [Vicinamibacterales bacterium]